jgi:hypothetical protein
VDYLDLDLPANHIVDNPTCQELVHLLQKLVYFHDHVRNKKTNVLVVLHLRALLRPLGPHQRDFL